MKMTKLHTGRRTVLTTLAVALCAVIFSFGSALAETKGKSTKGDPTVTPWNDPKDPYVIRLNRDDPPPNAFFELNDKLDRSIRGPIDLQRYKSGHNYDAFPTFLGQPIARFPEDLKAGDIDIAIVGSTTDMNSVQGTSWAANMLRGFITTSASYFKAKGDGKRERFRNEDSFVDQWVRSSLDELNIVDYGNIKRHNYSGEKSAEEMRRVLGEIYEGGAVPMMVGGSHDNMYGVFLAVADEFGRNNFCVMHFDSHIDTVTSGYGFYVHNANGMYMGVQQGLFKGSDAVHVGLGGTLGPWDSMMKWTRDNGFRYHFKAEIEKDGWDTVMRRALDDVKDCENLVITLDIDLMDQVYVPGTGGREPDGPTSQQMQQMMRALGIQNNVVFIEISEYNPMLDHRNYQTATVVRRLMEHFLYGLAARKRGITDPFYYHPLNIDDGR